MIVPLGRFLEMLRVPFEHICMSAYYQRECTCKDLEEPADSLFTKGIVNL
jgi:hypothetical protein